MPRKLPWLAEPSHKVSSTTAGTTVRPIRRSSDDLVDANLDSTAFDTPPRQKKKRPERTPSTSPPPAPPDVEYMREGYDADDVYLMVEDEFLSVAKMFTQHLHHAEYVKFKKLAASRGANALDAIARPVDGKTEQTGNLKMNIEAQERGKKIKTALKKATGEDDTSSGDEDDYMRDMNLAALMTADTSPSKKLSGVSKPQSNTRAAAGLVQSPRNIEGRKGSIAEHEEPEKIVSSSRKILKLSEEDEDSSTDDGDLDTIPTNSTPVTKPRLNDSERLGGSGSRDIFKGFARPLHKPSSTQRKQGAPVPNPADNIRTSASSNFLAKRRAEREKREREEKRNAASEVEIPTFAI